MAFHEPHYIRLPSGQPAAEIICKLVDRIILKPNETKDGLLIGLHGDLAGILGLAGKRLKEIGIISIDILPFDTYANADNFLSYRRTTHYCEEGYGSQISVIMIS